MFQSGFTWTELNNLDIFEIYQLWIARGRQKELERALSWYQETINRINREAREPMKTGKDKTKPRTPEQIKARTVELKEKYFKLEKRDPAKEKKKYYNDIVLFRDFLKNAKR